MPSSSDDPSSLPPPLPSFSPQRRFPHKAPTPHLHLIPPIREEHHLLPSLAFQNTTRARGHTMRRARGGRRWGLLCCAWMCALLMLGTTMAEGTPVQAAPLSAIKYISFQAETLSLYPWYGDKIVLLTSSGSLDE